jgi:ABC-type phosphate transport system substrate-binding protein
MPYLIKFLCLALLLISGNASAELAVVANPNSGIEKLSKDEVINIYMGRTRKLPNGLTGMPIDLSNTHHEKMQFYSLLVGKELAEINSYWARLRFSGLGQPPLQVNSMEDAINLVSENKGAIAYIDSKKIDKRVKLILLLSN